MSEYNFLQRKNDILSKKDKSYRQEWDKKAKKVCQKINLLSDHYTTSSCSGRALLMIDQEKKGSGLFIWVSHEKITSDEIKKALQNFKGRGIVKFKCEPPILHIVSRNIEFAESILKKGQDSGFKNSGIINLNRNPVVELHGTEKLEFPVFMGGKFLVDNFFLDLIVKKSNKKLEKGWKILNSLEKSI